MEATMAGQKWICMFMLLGLLMLSLEAREPAAWQKRQYDVPLENYELIPNHIKVPQFSGDSFLKYNDDHFYYNDRIGGKASSIQMKVRATSPDGLLYWIGGEEERYRHDYFAIGLKNGYAQFGYDLGSGEVVITVSGTRIDDGQWHTIRVRRYNQLGQLTIDGTNFNQGRSPGIHKQLDSGSTFFIGGMENISQTTNGKYTGGLVGCITDVNLGSTYSTFNLTARAVGEKNIKECS